MHSSICVVPRVVAALVFVSLVSPLVPFSAAADPQLRARKRCQATIAKAGDTFVTRQLTEIGKCATTTLTCIEHAASDPACLASSSRRCTRDVARLTVRFARLTSTITARCRRVDPSTLFAPDGLGFTALAAQCPELVEAGADAYAVGACVVRLHRCEAERLLASASPRAGELLRIAGVPTSARATLACLPDLGGTGTGVDVGGEAVARCARSIGRAAARLVSRTLANVATCARAVSPCVDGSTGDPACVAAATATCDGAFARIAGARLDLGRALEVSCGADRMPFEELAAGEGANLGALVDECAAVQVDEVSALPSFALCLARSTECRSATVIRNGTPRVDALLGLVGRSLDAPFCPGPEPSATPTVGDAPTPPATATPNETPSPSPTPTGPTATPRPGETATLTASATPTPSVTTTPSRTATSIRSATPTRTPTPKPTSTPVCGNGIVEGDEQCDGLDLDGNDCDFLCTDEPDPQGPLACRPSCTYDFSGCRGVDCEAP